MPAVCVHTALRAVSVARSTRTSAGVASCSCPTVENLWHTCHITPASPPAAKHRISPHAGSVGTLRLPSGYWVWSCSLGPQSLQRSPLLLQPAWVNAKDSLTSPNFSITEDWEGGRMRGDGDHRVPAGRLTQLCHPCPPTPRQGPWAASLLVRNVP